LEKQKIYHQFCKNEKQIAILLDPDKNTKISDLKLRLTKAQSLGASFIFVGGSLIAHSIDEFVKQIKKITTIPVVLFPGSVIQISAKADALLFLSLISGRNADFLIGNHVIAAPFLKKSELEIISTGYLLIESGVQTSVEYMSYTKPIPYSKTDIAVATAIAGELLGNKLIYLEAGSGAQRPVSFEMINQVKKNISVPLIVGGGLRTKNQIMQAFDAGADVVVIGTALEENIHFSEL
jgi:putative glycerol-1-phosphate prenyltransferase